MKNSCTVIGFCYEPAINTTAGAVFNYAGPAVTDAKRTRPLRPCLRQQATSDFVFEIELRSAKILAIKSIRFSVYDPELARTVPYIANVNCVNW